jgi:rSAM/selenodomain-associated transferase 2
LKPQLSIIIPVLNEAGHIAATLQALQPLRDRCQLLLVDGGSTDGSVASAEPLVDSVLHSPRGRALQMNCGAAQAQTDVLLFLHVDTLLPDNAVNLIMTAIAEGFCWGRFNVSFDNSRTVFKMIAFMMNQRSRLTGIATGDQALFVTRDAFQAVGGFPNIRLMEDIAISARLKTISTPCCLNDCVITSARRWLQYGVVKTILLMWWLRLRYFFGTHPDNLAACYYRKR